MDELAAPAIAAIRERPRPVHAGEPGQRRARLAREHPPLEHLAAALVGPPDPGLVLPGRPRRRRPSPSPRRAASAAAPSSTQDADVLDTWFSSALWPFATLGWPERDARARALLPDRRPLDRARHHLPLGEPDDHGRPRADRRDARSRDVIIHSIVLAPDGRRMSKSLGTGIDPVEVIEAHGADATRYGLLKMSSTQDVRFAVGFDRGGAQAREQALERRPADPPARGRASRPAARPAIGRGALDPRAPRRRRRREVEEQLVAVRVRAASRRALPPDVRRLLRLVRRGDQAAAARRRTRTPRRPRWPRSSGCSRCSTR